VGLYNVVWLEIKEWPVFYWFLLILFWNKSACVYAPTYATIQVIPVVALPYVFTQRLNFINIQASQSNSFQAFAALFFVWNGYNQLQHGATYSVLMHVWNKLCNITKQVPKLRTFSHLHFIRLLYIWLIVYQCSWYTVFLHEGPSVILYCLSFCTMCFVFYLV